MAALAAAASIFAAYGFPQQSGAADSAGAAVSVGDAVGSAWQALLTATRSASNWATYGGTFEEQRFSRLTQITDRNVGQLGFAWSYEFDTNRAQETTPLELDGVIYATTAWSKVVALDAVTGKLLWQYDPQVPGEFGAKGCCDVGNRGAAIYDGKLYFGTFDGRLIALDIKTGKPVWSVVTVDQSKTYTITGAPRVVKGKVLIGNGGAELGARGYVTAYDAQTGKQVWRFYTVPGDPAKGPDNAASDAILAKLAKGTWFGDYYYKTGGGGTVWDSIVYDEELDQLYIGVGNGSPWNHRLRSEGKGDNLFLSSIVALNPDTGAYLWHYQASPGETWDYTNTQQITLATLPVDGKPRKVLMQAPKNGFFFVIDRANGKLLSAKNFVDVNWATGFDMNTGRPIETPEARYSDKPQVVIPGALGAHNWQPMAYNPQAGLVYIPGNHALFGYAQPSNFAVRPGRWNLGLETKGTSPPEDPQAVRAARAGLSGRLIAWDPVNQREAWGFDYPEPWNGGVLTTAGNLVFQGDTRGNFRAFAADTGKVLWSMNLGMAIMAAPITFERNGSQYVAVAGGYGGAYALTSSFNDNPGPRPNGRLYVFKLGAKGELPHIEKLANPPANPASDAFTPAQVSHGEELFQRDCWACHGPGAISSGVVPDLRRSGMLPSAEAWNSVVIGGVLKDRGMISFAATLTSADAEDLRAYVSSRARLLAREEGTK
ncbi:MAG: PQQ-dependent dehydrogenase, methanol/ethanol family [Proteobacteria bacterium]|nr:PQQ-dependent dehydrogenase, methanol/ethanol family [Pseudomonadota bacterium]